jgi:hypothetical protein
MCHNDASVEALGGKFAGSGLSTGFSKKQLSLNSL